MYADDGGDDIRKTHPRKTVTFVCWLDGGDVPGYTMAIFPSRVRSVSVQRSTGNDPARIEWQVSITDVPHEAVIVPALS
jgi:hypothetical protein